jgi:hypothetical protein
LFAAWEFVLEEPVEVAKPIVMDADGVDENGLHFTERKNDFVAIDEVKTWVKEAIMGMCEGVDSARLNNDLDVFVDLPARGRFPYEVFDDAMSRFKTIDKRGPKDLPIDSEATVLFVLSEHVDEIGMAHWTEKFVEVDEGSPARRLLDAG